MKEMTMLRIAIPTKNDRLYPHFGRAPRFTIFQVDPDSGRILQTDIMESSPQEECRGAINALLRRSVDVVIVGGIGAGAHRQLTAAGIEVFAGAGAEATETVVRQFLAGELPRGEPTCHGHERGDGHHHHHGDGHHHEHGDGHGQGRGRGRGHGHCHHDHDD
jgi:predicted Fe-Mo cluster-binding NifX family protein